MPNSNPKIEAIREKCIEANPTDNRWNVILADEEKVRLADVLLALGRFGQPYSVSSGGAFEKWDNIGKSWRLVEYRDGEWDLYQDDLTLQSDETIDFLFTLLNK